MKTKTMGAMIAQRRKEMGMTQLELANKMGVTDKAVSKWISIPFPVWQKSFMFLLRSSCKAARVRLWKRA